jgi:chondroitin 4-sulfotransferase 11
MPISHQHRAIFIHIPKTAGTSIEAALGMHGDKHDIGIVPYFNQVADRAHLYGRDLQHMTAARLKAVLEDDAAFARYFKFTVVRNPWERLVSTSAWSDQKWAQGRQLEPMELDQLVRRMYAAFTAARSSASTLTLPPHLYPQYLYLIDEAHRLMVDFVARYENLAQDWLRICERLQLSVPLPQRMKSHHRPYREYYSDETRGMIAEIYAGDLQLFGYEF